MTKLKAINIMLSYVNEMPLSSLTNTLPIELLASNILEEELYIVNQIFAKSYSSIEAIPTTDESYKLEMYMVRRASKSLFTRTIGFEDKGLEVIMHDIKESMGTVNEVIIDKYLSLEKYYINYVNSLLVQSTSIEESVRICKNIKSSIDSIVVPAGIVDTVRYKSAILMLNAGSELGLQEKQLLIKEYALSYLQSKTGLSYFKNYILSLVQNSNTVAEVTQIIESVEDTITAIVSPTVFDDEEKNQYRLAVLVNNNEKIFYLNNKYAKSYIASKSNIDYFKSFILANIKGQTISEITSEVDTFEDTILSIVVPDGIDSDAYKLAVLQMSVGMEIGKAEKDLLVSSMLNTNIKDSSIKDILKGYIDKVIDKSSVESITDGIANIKARFDYGYDSCVSEYINIPEVLKERYSLADMLKDTGTEIATIDRKDIMKSLARYVYSNSTSIPDYAKNILLSVELFIPYSISDIDATVKAVINIVEREKEVVMNYGWNYNTIVVTLQPNTDGYIVVPTNYLSVDAVDEQTNVIVSNYKLFDTDENSFIFDGGVECVVVQDLILDELSNSLYNVVISKSKLTYAVSMAMNSNTISMLKNEYDMAIADAKREDAMSIDANILSDEFVTTLTDRTRS